MAPAPTLAIQVRSLLTHAVSAGLTPRSVDGDGDGGSPLGPLAVHNAILARDDASNNQPDPDKGIIHPGDINNNAMFALFGIIGAAFVCLGIWFFFWARNGGFYFKKDDWDDYKSTVLRRKGPNGTILSGATPSTQLGGGSVYKDVDDGSTEDATTVVSGTTGITGGVSDIVGRDKRRRKREQKEREKERRREEKAREKEERKRSKSRTGTGTGGNRKVDGNGEVIDEEAEALAKAQLRNYRHERPARVGGLNKESDGSAWDGSTNPSNSTMTGTESTVTSELISNRERTPTNTPTKKSSGGIRKVYSTADRTADRESDRIRAEARKLQEKGRSAQRRDFSFQRAESAHMLEGHGRSDDGDSRVPGSWAESDVGSEVGTKSYHHVIPGLSSTASTSDYQEEKRKKRGGAGYRRGRQDEMSEISER